MAEPYTIEDFLADTETTPKAKPAKRATVLSSFGTLTPWYEATIPENDKGGDG